MLHAKKTLEEACYEEGSRSWATKMLRETHGFSFLVHSDDEIWKETCNGIVMNDRTKTIISKNHEKMIDDTKHMRQALGNTTYESKKRICSFIGLEKKVELRMLAC